MGWLERMLARWDAATAGSDVPAFSARFRLCCAAAAILLPLLAWLMAAFAR